MPAAVAQGSPGDVVVAIDVPHDAGKVPRDSDVMGETPPEVTVAFEAISFWVPATLGPPSTFSKDGLKRLVPGMAKATKETKDDMRQVRWRKPPLPTGAKSDKSDTHAGSRASTGRHAKQLHVWVCDAATGMSLSLLAPGHHCRCLAFDACRCCSTSGGPASQERCWRSWARLVEAR